MLLFTYLILFSTSSFAENCKEKVIDTVSDDETKALIRKIPPESSYDSGYSANSAYVLDVKNNGRKVVVICHTEGQALTEECSGFEYQGGALRENFSIRPPKDGDEYFSSEDADGNPTMQGTSTSFVDFCGKIYAKTYPRGTYYLYDVNQSRFKKIKPLKGWHSCFELKGKEQCSEIKR